MGSTQAQIKSESKPYTLEADGNCRWCHGTGTSVDADGRLHRCGCTWDRNH